MSMFASLASAGLLIAEETPEAALATWSFDKDDVGAVPPSWRVAETKGTGKTGEWAVSLDTTAPSKPNVLTLDTQAEGRTYNLLIAESTSVQDLDLRVRIKAIRGEVDQGGGLIWRCKDADNYYVCRINPLESNFRVYKVENGKRSQLDTVELESKTGRWYEVRAVMVGDRIECFVDGQKYLSAEDDTFKEAGMIGLWTKADASSSFDDVVVRHAASNEAGNDLTRAPTGVSVVAPSPLKLVREIPLPGVKGRMDHLTLDATGTRLWIAALGNNTVEVIDLRSGVRIKSIGGIEEPTGVALWPETNRVIVASGADGMVRAFDASFNVVASIQGLDDADNVRIDPVQKRVYAAFGDGAIAVLAAHDLTKLAEIKLAAHPESFQLEPGGARMFANVPNARQLAVIDRKKAEILATWPVTDAQANYPMAIDAAHKRLIVAFRHPARLVALDIDSGKPVASLECCGDADDVFLDPVEKRIYVSGGEGCISVFAQEGADKYEEVRRVTTASGARTSLLVPETKTLYLAVPHRPGRQAAIWEYRIQP